VTHLVARLLALLLLLWSPAPAFALGKGCGTLDIPADELRGRQLFIRSNRQDSWQRLLYSSKYLLQGRNLHFLYLIQRDSVEDRRGGFLMVRVVRLEKDSANSNYVTLFRNRPLPPCCDFTESKWVYKSYHTRGFGHASSAELKAFHVRYQSGDETERTDSDARRPYFSYPTINIVPGVNYNYFTMLIRYDGIDDDLSCIGFDLDMSSLVTDMKITILELDVPPGEGYAASEWDIKSTDNRP
jgi:hypothetical protein